MLAKLQRLWTKYRARESARIVDDRRYMTPDERGEAELVQRDGVAGEAEALLEREARRREEREEGRPRDY
jgi:hypothetical protein